LRLIISRRDFKSLRLIFSANCQFPQVSSIIYVTTLLRFEVD